MEEFEIKDGVLIKYHEIEGKTSVVVPNSVTKIGEFAFKGCSNLIDIILPEGVTEIGFCSFMECINLKNITFPKSLISLDTEAFQNCKNLTNIVLPENVIQMGYAVFIGCTSLTNITLPENIIEISYGTFVDCSKLIKFNASEKTFDVLTYLDKYSIISNFANQYNTNNIYTNEDIKRYKKFILLTKKELLRIIEDKILEEYIQQKMQRIQNIGSYKGKTTDKIVKKHLSLIIKNRPLLYFMCNDMDNAFTANELDELIKVSAQIGEVETTGLLMDYKHNHFGDGNYLDSLNLDEDLGNSK